MTCASVSIAGDVSRLGAAAAKLSQPYSSMTLKESKMTLAIPPRYIGREDEFFKLYLSAQMGKYNSRLLCVPVGYKKIKQLGYNGVICNEDPNVYMTIWTELIVFMPTEGCELEAVVNKTSLSHVGMLVHNAFNASIIKDDDMFIIGDPKVGDEIVIRVMKIIVVGRVLSLQAKLVRILKVCAKFETEKQKHLIFQDGDVKDELVTPDEDESAGDEPIKKSNKTIKNDKLNNGSPLKDDLLKHEKENASIAMENQRKESHKKRRHEFRKVKEEIQSDVNDDGSKDVMDLLSSHLGHSETTQVNDDVETVHKKKKAKKRKNDTTNEKSIEAEQDGNCASPKKKKKRIKEEIIDNMLNGVDCDVVDSNVNTADNNPSPRKHRKKRKSHALVA